ncbi:cytochrome d ubiquinol oxidase subunit II [Haloterrigena salifodinae]|uniref:Cytochrome d ubiquinol oxidase subunit II n=1 Tax=Haloterrigena salifodinae TaxID=2675099 RepID=A0A8T8DY38_9EURY|nr:cytochrome d ubiquinol oxidase subunit II [Haloterrigena salifodinae]QRV14287.1 cytochrome d ubiquinol oxidase subunit II [Haloterrigena salifodinae]
MTESLSATEPALAATSAYLVESLPELWFGLVVATFGVYLLLDGFDFGVGVLFAEADETDRRQFLAAFGPLWKANEVWLVLFGTVLFAGFPAAYAAILGRYYLAVFALLLALGLRGLGSKFRGERDDERWVRFWDRCFVVGSAAAPFLLGAFAASWALGEPSVIAVVPLLAGAATVALVTALGAAFLCVKLESPIRDRLVRRGRAATAGYVALGTVTLVASVIRYPALRSEIQSVPMGGLCIGTIACAGIAVAAATGNRYRWFAVATAGLAVAFAAFIGVLLYPAIDPATGTTIADAVAAPLSLNLTTGFAVVFLPLIGSYFVVLYSLFDDPASDSGQYQHG